VRADVVYFRQDFSAMHKVAIPEKWPEIQRFDYLVRKRELTAREAEKVLAGMKDRGTRYTRDHALTYALYALNGATVKKAP
jgi:hypothetical protein